MEKTTTTVITLLIAQTSFALVHSCTASLWFKAIIKRSFGEIFLTIYYRFIYCTVSFLMTVGLIVLYFSLHDDKIYKPPVYILWPLHGLQVTGLCILILSLKSIDLWEFLGIDRIWKWIRDRSAPGHMKILVTYGIYGWTRHPAYLGGIMIFLLEPNLTVKTAITRATAVLYFILGTFLEDRRLHKEFGDTYERYAEYVPMLIPGLKRSL